ncbi:putative phage tail protein, partial [Anoxybacillus sp. KU2-6(11)]
MSNLFQYLPNYYQDIREFPNLIGTENEEVEQLSATIDEVLEQFYVDTATWGLSHWERIC